MLGCAALAGLPWAAAALTQKLELSVLIFLFFFSFPFLPSWLSPCGLMLPCSVLLLATGAGLKGGAVEEERGPALTKRGVA